MINRIGDRLEGSGEDEPEEDFWEVTGDAGWFYVSEATARRILGQLERQEPPRWLRFADLFGAEVRVRAEGIECVRECTRVQRGAERGFRRARRDEKKADRRPWEDDDWMW